MAQQDIKDIANYMKMVDESKEAEEKACDEACKECEEQNMLEDAELEDEVIDKASLGFIDDSDIKDEADEFYAEDDQNDTFEEDVSDYIEQETVDEEPKASIEVAVYNEDGFGEQFAKEVSRNIPGVKATVKRTLPNGDLLVKMEGFADDLQNAYAFYVGKEDYDVLPQEDKEEFESLLVFDDGDTLAEADYREAVAHCLDPIGVKASTANLAAQDTCALSIIKEEKVRRFAKKAMKCLKENDLSDLSDEELDALDAMQDAANNGHEMSPENDKAWQLILKDMGYTQAEWDAMTPEKREKVWKFYDQPEISRTGFGDTVKVGVDKDTGKQYRYRTEYIVKNPETGAEERTTFNPNYDADHSMYQHPAAMRRQAKKDAKNIEQAGKEKIARDAMKKVRGRKDTWDTYEFAQMLTALDDKQRKELMNDLIADIESEYPDDPRKAGEEIMFIKKIFGKKLTLRDFAKAWGKSAPGVMKFADETQAIWRRTCREMGINSAFQFKSMPTAKFEAFKELLKKNMGERKGGSIVSGR